MYGGLLITPGTEVEEVTAVEIFSGQTPCPVHPQVLQAWQLCI